MSPCSISLVLAIAAICCQNADAIDITFRRSEKVEVYDAETDEPIADAEIVSQPVGIFLLGMPKKASATTADDGAVTIKLPTLNPMWRVSANGYLPEVSFGREQGTKRFHLYKAPRPRIGIVVPDGYRGPLKVEMRLLSERVQDEIGKRKFTFYASDDGYVAFEAAPLLLKTLVDAIPGQYREEIHAVYENGDKIPDNWRYEASGIGLRHVSRKFGNKNLRVLYVIGTDKDEEAMDRAITHRKPDGHGGLHITSNWEAFDALFDRHAERERLSSR